ncbi:ABC transporter substrate-binding protein [Butyrivibrio sp. INlla16]|uniref:ABC transporter substrate-binding protein n=1 Tax=Butyrivibrio sp. INlla16 TaxID=1520807 RepID=UPI00088AC1D8|nr:ABC transporter substrate-binding protein [Butyrivibrio sp. INlla16]SDB58543.1 peptide/nickel transport system substrate-binding protein [Butyrivibrio sp. INlla16]
MKKKILSMILTAVLAVSAVGCGGSGESQPAEDTAKTENTQTETAAEQTDDAVEAEDTTEAAGDTTEADASSEPKILKAAASFAYPSLDVHKEYYGWYTSIYGISEALFKMDENMNAASCLAKDATSDGSVWTITLNDGVAFSNGNPLTAEMVIKNLQRVAEVNERFAYLSDFEMTATDDKTITIDTKEVYPTLRNELASPELGMVDLDATTDFDNAPVCTGPFVIKSFQPEGDVEVSKNESYWGGDVKLDGAIFYYMQEDDPKLLAMQSGEIDCYNSVSSAALAVYEQEPDKYNVVSIPGARLQFYILNENNLDDAVREAINLTVDKDAIAAYLEGTVSAAVGPFSPSAAYGKVTVPAVDTAKAKEVLEADGYTLGSDGIYEKDGKKLSINIKYYAARSLDTLALLIQEQLKAVGIDSVLGVEEDPDSTYIANGDFDLALYCMIADKAGDPLYFIESAFKEGAYYDCGGFSDDHCEELIGQLMYETDTAKRAELANEIVQIVIDDNAFGFVGLFNSTTVLRPGVSGFAENIPFDFYGVDAETDIE